MKGRTPKRKKRGGGLTPEKLLSKEKLVSPSEGKRRRQKGRSKPAINHYFNRGKKRESVYSVWRKRRRLVKRREGKRKGSEGSLKSRSSH